MLDKIKDICFGEIYVYCRKQDVCLVRTFFCCGFDDDIFSTTGARQVKCGTEILLDHKHIYIYVYIYILYIYIHTYCAGNTVNGNKHGDRAIFEGTSDRRQETRISKYL